MKRKHIPKSKRPVGRPKVPRKRISKRVHPAIYDDIITYITQKSKEYKKSKGEL
jgi:hypothetical protein